MIGSIVKAYNNQTNKMEDAELVNIRYNVPCCVGTESEHTHDVLYDVRFLSDNRLSKGHISVN